MKLTKGLTKENWINYLVDVQGYSEDEAIHIIENCKPSQNELENCILYNN